MNATVHTLLKFHISCHQGRVLQEFQKKVESYIQENPNVWDTMIFFRLEDIDPNNEVVTYRLAVRSRFTWQICNRVFQSQADLHMFCVALSFRLGINYDAPNTRSIMYFGGSLVDGGVQDYKANILQNDNISNDKEILPGLVPKDMLVTSVRNSSQRSLDNEEMAPRFGKTVMESRAMEQQAQDTNDDEMDLGSTYDQSKEEGTNNERADSNDQAGEAFLHLLQKSHGA